MKKASNVTTNKAVPEKSDTADTADSVNTVNRQG